MTQAENKAKALKNDPVAADAAKAASNTKTPVFTPSETKLAHGAIRKDN